MATFKISVTGEYADGSTSTRTYSIDAPNVERAKQLAAVLFGRDEFDAGKSAPTTVHVDEIP